MSGDYLTFGELLKSEREKRQETLDHIAYELKIRRTVLESFEQMRFEEFPPEGYTQGMISSYARYLGLDPVEVLEDYRRELGAYERKRASAYAKNRSTSQGIWESKKEGSRRGSGAKSAHQKPSKPSIAGRGTAVATGKERHAMPWKFMLLIAAVILVVGLGIWGLFSLFSRNDTSPPPPPVTNTETTTTPTDTNTVTPSDEDTAALQGGSTSQETTALPFEVEISVKAGETSWVEVEVDGDRGYVGSLVGPAKKTYTVSDKTQIIVGRPSVVTITRNGEPVKITTGKGTGKVILSVEDKQ
jgi:cytoskeletal protein RodZ